eukprot:m.212927 g.212927  ORF g.212927 m.212927 type:complete len:177 (+) comp15508_c0_seq1:241-771(+)
MAPNDAPAEEVQGGRAAAAAAPDTEEVWWVRPAQPIEGHIWTGAQSYRDGDNPHGKAGVGGARVYAPYQPTAFDMIEAPVPCPHCGPSLRDQHQTIGACEHGHKFGAVMIKSLDGPRYIIPYGKWECWGWYKERIQEISGIPVTEQRLIFAGVERPDSDRHSGLQTKSTVHLVSRS